MVRSFILWKVEGVRILAVGSRNWRLVFKEMNASALNMACPMTLLALRAAPVPIASASFMDHTGETLIMLVNAESNVLKKLGRAIVLVHHLVASDKGGRGDSHSRFGTHLRHKYHTRWSCLAETKVRYSMNVSSTTLPNLRCTCDLQNS